ncbi:MAG TPA: 3-oxoacyl-ACP reductase [Gammaproteobacteria bacterium]|nr:3-oxoacyl-ACP reductase [Gammaproteobacteria bacterium]|tara:strand:- start:832 stop:1581 length:750 start_codon:yes stop_codon:yes gene_type:complete
MRLAGRKAVVTGASGGIGQAIAAAFVREGAKVVAHYYRNESTAAQFVAKTIADGGKAWAVGADVADMRDVEQLVGEAQSLLGGIDIWANIAGADILTGAGATLSDADKLARLIDVDLRGTIQCCRAASSVISSGGAIINLSWDLALIGMKGRNPEMFSATKAGVTGYTRSLARSLAPAIRVNEIAPGWIETTFVETEMEDAYRARVIEQTPLGRLGRPEDVAHAAVYLASDESSFVTGQTLKVNGGFSS